MSDKHDGVIFNSLIPVFDDEFSIYSDAIIECVDNSLSEYKNRRDNLQLFVDYMTDRINEKEARK